MKQKLTLKYARIVHLLVLVESVIEFLNARNAQYENILITFKNFEFVHHRCVYQLDLLCDSIIYYIQVQVNGTR
jgi:hypothetical protein